MMDKRAAIRRLKKILEVLSKCPEWKRDRFYRNKNFEIEAFSTYSVEIEWSRDTGARFYREEPDEKVRRERSYTIGLWLPEDPEFQPDGLALGDSWEDALADWIGNEANGKAGRKYDRFFYGPETRAFLLRELDQVKRKPA